MEAIHGVLEWFIILAVVAIGIVADRVAPYKRVRYPLYIVLLLMAFIFDLNKVSFRHAAADAALYFLIMVIIVEIILICVRKKSLLLIGGAFVLLVPVFLYVYAALLLIVPLPCHEKSGGVVGVYEACGGKKYVLVNRPSFDPFKPARVYSLNKEIRYTPLKKQVDRYTPPKGYIEARLYPQWQCLGDGRANADLIVDGYTIWTLEDKVEGK
jgi:hypothetical protein